MSVLTHLKRRHAAQQQAVEARQQLLKPASSLLERVHRHPLGLVVAAGACGVVLGRLNVHPLRIPGAGSALGGGVAQLLLKGTRLLVTVGLDKVLEGVIDQPESEPETPVET